MKQLRRYLLNAIVGFSLLTFVLTVGLWVRSHFAPESITYNRLYLGRELDPKYPGAMFDQSNPGGLQYVATIEDGSLTITRTIEKFTQSEWHGSKLLRYDVDNGPLPPPLTMAFVINQLFGNNEILSLPMWLLAIAFGILPTAYFVRWIRRIRQFPPGHCLQCGYDLRATPNRCPECGTIPKAGTENTEATEFTENTTKQFRISP